MKPRFVFVHGNETTHWSFGWAPWLKAELERLGFETFFETMPDSIIARATFWLPFLRDHVRVGQHDVVIGWSSGAVAAMRYAEDNKIRGSILVSPSYTDLGGDELEKQSGYYDKSWDWERIRANQSNIAVVWGDDDPYIPQHEFSFIADQLNAERLEIHHGKHFIERTEFPELLNLIKHFYS